MKKFFTSFIAATALLFLIGLTSPAWAATGSSSDFTLWIKAGVFAFFAFLLAFGVVTYRRLPLLGLESRQEREFWRTLIRQDTDVLGVLYSERNIAPWIGYVGWFGVRRLKVTVRNRHPKRDKVIYRCVENPNTFLVEDTIAAFSAWIKTAEEHRVPAVYRCGRDLHVLSQQQIAEMWIDPVAFVAKFQDHIRRGKPLREPVTASDSR